MQRKLNWFILIHIVGQNNLFFIFRISLCRSFLRVRLLSFGVLWLFVLFWLLEEYLISLHLRLIINKVTFIRVSTTLNKEFTLSRFLAMLELSLVHTLSLETLIDSRSINHAINHRSLIEIATRELN